MWSYDLVFNHCADGQQLKCLTMTDEFTKEGLAIDVDGRIRSARVIEVLSRLVSDRGAPAVLRSDNGPEFVSKALLSWTVAQGICTALIEPGKPWQIGVAEKFNGKFRKTSGPSGRYPCAIPACACHGLESRSGRAFLRSRL